jgi:hypothetical protein
MSPKSLNDNNKMTNLWAHPIIGPVMALLVILAIGLVVGLIYAVVIPGIWWLLTGQVAVNVPTRSKTQHGRYKVIRRGTPPWRRLFNKTKRH